MQTKEKNKTQKWNWIKLCKFWYSNDSSETLYSSKTVECINSRLVKWYHHLCCSSVCNFIWYAQSFIYSIRQDSKFQWTQTFRAFIAIDGQIKSVSAQRRISWKCPHQKCVRLAYTQLKIMCPFIRAEHISYGNLFIWTDFIQRVCLQTGSNGNENLSKWKSTEKLLFKLFWNAWIATATTTTTTKTRKNTMWNGTETSNKCYNIICFPFFWSLYETKFTI